ncbi:trans-sulfuration enzyme family protein [Burkholderia stabilis]|jgi:cystathionine beta-lyase/cystathionine gamma-synthase|uniref:trans-sulfuration enzyme family protein n=1 Tax=Burkholderia stabilis TaxID=95485 RepID=UPI001590733C|nr:PLP-dependent aspartate aminotransferase family protein [Burkholderia stabilis]
MEHLVKGDPAAALPGVGTVKWVNEMGRKRQSGPSQRLSGHGSDSTTWRPATTAVHAGTHDDPVTGAVGTPIYQTSTFILGEDQYRAVEEGYARDRFIYTRYGNPSQWAVQEKLAALEGAESAIVFSSGMAAISATMLSMLDKGAHVVASNELYGGTYNFFHHELPSLGFTVSYVNPRDISAIEAAIQPNTMVLYFETMTNPLVKVVDMPAIGELAKRRSLRLVVDATFTTPLGMHPLEHGAHVVVHSCTKYLNGHSDLVAGVAMGARKHMDAIWPRLLAYGGCLDPHACFLLERSLKTLPLRMRAHAEGAHAVATFLQQHPKVREVHYPGLPSHADHALAKKLLSNMGGMIAFAVESDAMALKLLDRLQLMRQATSLGGVETLVSLPYNTSHAAYTSDQRTRLGIPAGCVRLSVGIEDPQDLIADLEQALAAL